MGTEIISREKIVPGFDKNAVAVKCIEYYGYGDTYNSESLFAGTPPVGQTPP